MQILQAGFGLVLSLFSPALFWAQAMPAPIVDPPRQQMQTVAPNVLVGPYLVNVTGKTFVSDVFLDIAITDNGQAVADGTTVTFDAVPTRSGDSVPDGGGPVHLTTVTNAGHAKLAPDLASAGDWLITLSVTGRAGDATSAPLKVGIDPHRPPDTLPYIISMIALPIVSVIILVAFFRLRHVELERWPTRQREGYVSR